MVRRLYLLLILLVFSMHSRASKDDLSLWTNISISKNFTQRWNISFDQGFRLRENISVVNRFSSVLEATYTVNTYLKFDGGYGFIYFHLPENGYEVRHRFTFSTIGTYSLNAFTFSLRERFQSTYRNGVEKTDTRANPKNILRSRFNIFYNIPYKPFTPYIASEFIIPLNDPQKSGLERIHFIGGTRYHFNNSNTLDFHYRYLHQLEKHDPGNHVLSIGYTIKL